MVQEVQKFKGSRAAASHLEPLELPAGHLEHFELKIDSILTFPGAISATLYLRRSLGEANPPEIVPGFNI